jgi:hypothetical protein
MLRKIIVLNLLIALFSVCMFPQQRKQLQKPSIRIAENFPQTLKGMSKGGKEINLNHA